MTSVRCSQGHPNPSENRFCYLCGEKILPALGQHQGLILGDRYRMVRELGHGGFGRTYLVEDLNRFNELCVLKEFAPQVRGTQSLEKAEELFGREAGVLYKLQHPQIPEFRELFRAYLEGRAHLFLVQDYVEGQTYRQILDARLQQGQCFSQLEVQQLMAQILPVLQYLHSIGVIHRDIAPDNLILRSSDQLPVLIDFGGVKQVAAEAESQFVSTSQIPSLTRLGKVGYAPAEQMQRGMVSAQSDLYALAVTALVLLTGEEPQDLFSEDGSASTWKTRLQLDPQFEAILDRMLDTQGDRFASAQAVLEALQLAMPLPALPLPNRLPPEPPVAPSLSTQSLSTQPVHVTPQSALPQRSFAKRRWLSRLLLLVLLSGGAAASWQWRDRWLPLIQSQISAFSPEANRKAALQSRRQQLGINADFLIKLTNATFYERYPDQRGRVLSDSAADAHWRKIWDDIASDWLNLLSDHLSPDARRKLGSYTSADRDQWKRQVNQLYVGSRSLFDLTDARFLHLFPEQRGKEFIDQPIGQIWQGIAADEVERLKADKTLSRIQFKSGSFSKAINGKLEAGTGHVYLANLSQGQILRLNLQAPAQSTRLSVYLPRPTAEQPYLLEDSTETTWAKSLPQSGFYEIVIVTNGDAIDYRLNLSVDNVSSSPVEPSHPEAPESKD